MDGVVGVHVAEVLQQRHEQQLVLDGGGEVHKLLRPVGHPQLRRHVRLWTGQTKSGFSPRGPLGVRPSTAPPSPPPRSDRRGFDATPLAEAPRALPPSESLKALIRKTTVINLCKRTRKAANRRGRGRTAGGGRPRCPGPAGCCCNPRGGASRGDGGASALRPSRPAAGGSRGPRRARCRRGQGGPRPPRLPSKRGSGLSSGNSMAGGGARRPAALGGNPPRHMPGAGVRPSPPPAGAARLPVGGPGAGPARMAAL